MTRQLGEPEWGFAICENKGRLLKGPVSVGHHSGVRVDVRCPQGRPVGIFHTHPYPPGELEPSVADIRATQRLGLSWLCIGQPHTGIIKCHRVKRR
jgi:proteasome lid subunit RPN8/RPN11